MKKFLTITMVAIMVTCGMGINARADDHPLKVELRGNLVAAQGVAMDFYPSYAFVLDVGAPVDFGFSWGTTDDGEDIIELSLPVTFYTYEWGAEGNVKSLGFQLFPTTNLKQGTSIKDRSIALGLVYDMGILDGIDVFARGVWHNYKLESMEDDVTDWGVQAGLVADAKL